MVLPRHFAFSCCLITCAGRDGKLQPCFASSAEPSCRQMLRVWCLIAAGINDSNGLEIAVCWLTSPAGLYAAGLCWGQAALCTALLGGATPTTPHPSGFCEDSQRSFGVWRRCWKAFLECRVTAIALYPCDAKEYKAHH